MSDLADLLERVLDKGVVVVGDITVSVVDIELLSLKVRLFIASAQTARELGMDWWTRDPFFTTPVAAAPVVAVTAAGAPVVAAPVAPTPVVPAPMVAAPTVAAPVVAAPVTPSVAPVPTLAVPAPGFEPAAAAADLDAAGLAAENAELRRRLAELEHGGHR